MHCYILQFYSNRISARLCNVEQIANAKFTTKIKETASREARRSRHFAVQNASSTQRSLSGIVVSCCKDSKFSNTLFSYIAFFTLPIFLLPGIFFEDSSALLYHVPALLLQLKGDDRSFGLSVPMRAGEAWPRSPVIAPSEWWYSWLLQRICTPAVLRVPDTHRPLLVSHSSGFTTRIVVICFH